MSCCPSTAMALTNVVLSTNTNYLTTRQSQPSPVKGTTATLAVVVPSMVGTATVTVSFWQSFDMGISFITTGSDITMTAEGVTTGAFTGLTAGLYMVQAKVAGTTVTVTVTVMVNFVSP